MIESSGPPSPSILLPRRISTRIYASIAALLALFLAAALIAGWSLVSLKSNVQADAEANRFATLIDRVERDFVNLQLDVQTFVLTGDPKVPPRIDRRSNHLRKEISQAQQSARDDVTADRLTEMQVRLDAYLKKYSQLASGQNEQQKELEAAMAREAGQLLNQSKQIREQTVRRIEKTSADTLSIASRLTFGAFLFAILAMLASLAITTLAVREIAHPIEAMTRTFSGLMQGKNDAKIPCLQRRDEIGEMARAAETFRCRNQQTEELLRQSCELADELDLQAKELQRSNDDLASFAYVASHDLRSPLRAIDNIATWLEEDVGESISNESQYLLGELRRRVRRMEQLLSELLEYSRVGQNGVQLTETNLHDLVADAVQLVDLPSDAEVIIEDPMPTIMADRGSLTRVFLNLLSNAIKYRSLDELRIECRCKREGHFVVFTVIDNGIGIAPKFHDRIFQMFKRLHSQSQIEGSGIGLALVQKLVEQAGGEISVESEEHRGASFRFTWPAIAPSKLSAPVANEKMTEPSE